MDQPHIVVGIDGCAASWRATRWAANLSEADEQVGDYGYGSGLAADVVVTLTRDYPSLMSSTSALAEILARGECPVVVRDGLAADPSTSARVVLGVSGSTGGRAAMRFACTEAVRAGVPVVAVRSSSEPDWQVAEASAIPASPEIAVYSLFCAVAVVRLGRGAGSRRGDESGPPATMAGLDRRLLAS